MRLQSRDREGAVSPEYVSVFMKRCTKLDHPECSSTERLARETKKGTTPAGRPLGPAQNQATAGILYRSASPTFCRNDAAVNGL